MSRTVLVVDDAAFVRGLIRKILSRDGYHVHEAVNGRDAIEKYRELRPDLVTLDINMPGVSGMEALRSIVGDDPAARVVMVSALHSEPVVAEAMGAGAVGFVRKPFQPKAILDVVHSSLCAAGG